LNLFAATLSAQSAPYQRLLIPIVPSDNLPGAFGSMWRGELTLFNASDDPVNVYLQVCPPIVNECIPRAELAAHRSIKPGVFPTAASQGAFLDIATADLAKVTIKFRVRDLSRQSQTWGTEIPLGPIAEFRHLVRLIEVPSDSRFRVRLRVYSAAGAATYVHLRAYKTDAISPISESEVALDGIRGQPPGYPSSSPAYAELEPIPPALPDADGTLRLEIEQRIAGEPPIWAFVSVTNNETQHVTLITP